MLCDYSAGWVSGAVSLLIGYPFDTIKIQQQIRGITFREAARRIFEHRGWRGYYRGLMIPLLSSGALNALFFGLYGDVRDYLAMSREEGKGVWGTIVTRTAWTREVHKRQSVLNKETSFDAEHVIRREATYLEMFTAGSVAGTFCLLFAAPIELVKTKLQSQMRRKLFRGPFDCLFTVVREAGVKGIYRGIVPMIIRNTLGTTIHFVVLCHMGLCHVDLFPSDHQDVLIAHGVAGFLSWVTCLPVDTVKSRMQADHHLRPHYRGTMHCLKDIYRNDGMIGLYRGFWSCAARSIPVNATVFIVYEYILHKLCKPH